MLNKNIIILWFVTALGILVMGIMIFIKPVNNDAIITNLPLDQEVKKQESTKKYTNSKYPSISQIVNFLTKPSPPKPTNTALVVTPKPLVTTTPLISDDQAPDPSLPPNDSTAAPTSSPVTQIETSQPTSATQIPTIDYMAGDANRDGLVNDIDYSNYWLPNYLSNNNCGISCGDFNEDGLTDEKDYIIWLINYTG